MSQNRKPPAFQEYAASILASREFRMMSLIERGLLFTLRMECWVNKKIPSDIVKLSKYLGCAVDEIKTALTDDVESYFIEKNGLYSCPELDDYRTHLELIRAKQSAGGKVGANLTNSGRKKVNADGSDNGSSMSSSNPSRDSQVAHRDGVESLVKPSTNQPSQNQSLDSALIADPFVADYVATENYTAEDYAKASAGL